MDKGANKKIYLGVSGRFCQIYLVRIELKKLVTYPVNEQESGQMWENVHVRIDPSISP